MSASFGSLKFNLLEQGKLYNHVIVTVKQLPEGFPVLAIHLRNREHPAARPDKSEQPSSLNIAAWCSRHVYSEVSKSHGVEWHSNTSKCA